MSQEQRETLPAGGAAEGLSWSWHLDFETLLTALSEPAPWNRPGLSRFPSGRASGQSGHRPGRPSYGSAILGRPVLSRPRSSCLRLGLVFDGRSGGGGFRGLLDARGRGPDIGCPAVSGSGPGCGDLADQPRPGLPGSRAILPTTWRMAL